MEQRNNNNTEMATAREETKTTKRATPIPGKVMVVDLGQHTPGKPIVLEIANVPKATPVSIIRRKDANMPRPADTIVQEGTVTGGAQTNSGTLSRTQFADGGFGDIGQQWDRVSLHKSQVVNNHTSLNLAIGDGGGTINIPENAFATAVVPATRKSCRKHGKHGKHGKHSKHSKHSKHGKDSKHGKHRVRGNKPRNE